MSRVAIKKYLASIGRKGGLVSSAAKTEAARRNAKLPRKKKNRVKITENGNVQNEKVQR